MDEEKLSLQDMAREFDMSYEYMRRLTRGDNSPSKQVLKLMSQRFRWDFTEVERQFVQDRFRQRNGELGGMAQDLDPEVQPFERGWKLLEPEQKASLLAQFNLFVSQNRKHNRGGLRRAADQPKAAS